VNSLAPDSVLKKGSPDTLRAPAAVRPENAVRPEDAVRLEKDFERAAIEHRPFLLGIAVASTRNPADAEDIVQEALMRAHRGLQGFRGDCPLRVWLARIVVRVSINHRRSFVRMVKRWVLFSDLEHPNSDGRVEAFDAPDPPSPVDREVMMDVEEHVGRLPQEFRAPLLMLAVDGMTIPEIAAILEIPEGTVKSRIFYGRKRLKKGLKL
jgi:RNA polymerase sigma-70 factor (ECF subfamily)